MAYSNIDKPNQYFNTVTYTGNGTTNDITVGFQPDFVWIKNRDVGTANHCLMDVIRGFGTGSSDTPLMNSNTIDAEFDRDVFSSTGITSTGYELDTYVDTNANTQDFVSWNWLGGGTASSNTDGSITSSVSANTTSGFSIVSYTGTGANATVGHGLGVAPAMVIVKIRSASGENWQCYHSALGGTQYIQLNNTNAAGTASNIWQDTNPTSSVFSIGTHGSVNTSSATYIAYCFADKKGYSKFGKYTGNGSADGTFVYTGFKPAFVIAKRTDTSGAGWLIFDNKRSPSNVIVKYLETDNSNAEASSLDRVDFLSNGFKCRGVGQPNSSGGTYIYMAFAENPLVGSNLVPNNAR